MIRDRLKRAARRLLKLDEQPAAAPQRREAYRPPTPASSRPLDLDLDDDEDDAPQGDDVEVDSAMVSEWIAEGHSLTFIDIRELPDLRAGHIEGALLIPISDVPNRHAELPADHRLVLYCISGARSFEVAQQLRQQGFTDAWSMVGGIGSWLAQGGQQVVPHEKAAFMPGVPARLTPEAAQRLSVPHEHAVGTIQESRHEGDEDRYILSFIDPEAGPRRLEGLSASDLAAP